MRGVRRAVLIINPLAVGRAALLFANVGNQLKDRVVDKAVEEGVTLGGTRWLAIGGFGGAKAR